jgi:hypothetical protein
MTECLTDRARSREARASEDSLGRGFTVSFLSLKFQQKALHKQGTSTSWVGKIGVGIGLYFLGVGNTIFTLSLLQSTITWGPPGLTRGLESLIKKIGTDRQKERKKDGKGQI